MNKTNYTQYIRYWRRRLKEEIPLNRKRAKELFKIAKNCARILKEEFKVRSIYLYGSLLTPEATNPWSDIDLAAEGIDPYWTEAQRRLYREMPENVKLDLIDITWADERLREKILKEGKRL